MCFAVGCSLGSGEASNFASTSKPTIVLSTDTVIADGLCLRPLLCKTSVVSRYVCKFVCAMYCASPEFGKPLDQTQLSSHGFQKSRWLCRFGLLLRITMHKTLRRLRMFH